MRQSNPNLLKQVQILSFKCGGNVVKIMSGRQPYMIEPQVGDALNVQFKNERIVYQTRSQFEKTQNSGTEPCWIGSRVSILIGYESYLYWW